MSGAGAFVNPQPVDFYGPMVRNQLGQMQLQMERQQQQQRNALAKLFAQPGNLDPSTGAPSANALAKVMSIDPITGMDLYKTEAQIQNQRAEQQVHTSEAALKRQELLQDMRGASYQAYREALDAGQSPDQARAAGQSAYTDGIESLKRSGAFPANTNWIPQFDPVRVQSQMLSTKDWLEARDREAQQSGGSGPAPGLALSGGGGQAAAGDIGAAIFAQESGSGANPQTSPAGAVGGYQIMPATFREYARPGERIDNPADNAAVGQRIIADLSQRFGGDPARIATGYFSGPQNVAPAGSPTPWIEDRKDATGKSTSSYVSDVLSRLRGGQGTQANLSADLVSDDPKKQADALDALAQNYASDLRPKDSAEAKMKATGIEAQLRAAAELLRSGDPAKIERGRAIAERIPDIGAGMLKGTPAGGTMDDKTLDFTADQVLAGDTSAMQNFGRGAQGAENLANLRKRVMQKAIDKGMSGADLAAIDAQFQGIKSGERTLGTRTAQVGMAVNEADRFASLASEAYDKLPRDQFVPLNRLQQLWESNTSSPEQAAAYAAVNSFINAYARAVSPTGTPTVSDKDHAREMLSTAMGPGAFHAVIGQLQKEMQAAIQSPGSVREEFKGAVTGKGDVGSQQQPAGGSGAPTKRASEMSDDELRKALGIQ